MSAKTLLLLPRGSVESTAVLQAAGAAGFLGLELEIVYTDAKPEVVHLKSAVTGDVSGCNAVIRALVRIKNRAADLLAEASPMQFGQVEELLTLFSTQLTSDAGAGAALNALNARLQPFVFATGNSFTVADAALYAGVHRAVSGLDEKARSAIPNVIRWFDHIQHLPSTAAAETLTAVASRLPIVAFQLTPVSSVLDGSFVAPAAAASGKDVKQPEKAEGKHAKQPKGDSSPAAAAASKPAAAPAASAAPAAAAEAASSSSSASAPAAAAGAGAGAGGDAAAKRKEARAKDKAAAAAAGGEGDKKAPERVRQLSKKELAALQLPIARLELKVGRIVKASPHPTEAKLYVEEVDCGEGKNRTVVSTFADYFPLSLFADGKKLCVVATNLEDADIKGVKSNGRIFDVQKDGKKEWLSVPAAAKVGERISFAGASGEPDKPLVAKKFRDILKEFGTSDKCVAQWKGIDLMTSAGPCTTATFTGAKLG